MAGLNKIKGDKSSEMDRYVCDGNEAVHFRLIRSVKDLEIGNGFHPEMCHQVFNEGETIFGYENLSIKVYLTAGSLKTYMGIKYAKKISKALTDGLGADEIEGKMKAALQGGYTSNFDEFTGSISKEEKEFKPLGELVHSFSTTFVNKEAVELKSNGPKTNGTNEGANERSFEIFLVDGISTPKFVQYLKRMETFLLFFIDAATFVNIEEDEKWRFFTLFEKYKTSEGNSAYAFVGYSSVYQFFAYPEFIRPRIGQMLILPPFQGQGLAVHLMSCLYSYYRKDPKVTEITVEDPSDDFEFLRDFVDARDCKKLASYAPDKLKNGFSSEMAEESHKVLKMTKRQAHRIYEILRLQVTNIHNDIEFKEYRIDVKRRLNIPYQKQEADVKRMLSRKIDDPELKKTTTLDDGTRKTELESNFQLLMTHYHKVVSRLEKFVS